MPRFVNNAISERMSKYNEMCLSLVINSRLSMSV